MDSSKAFDSIDKRVTKLCHYWLAKKPSSWLHYHFLFSPVYLIKILPALFTQTGTNYPGSHWGLLEGIGARGSRLNCVWLFIQSFCLFFNLVYSCNIIWKFFMKVFQFRLKWSSRNKLVIKIQVNYCNVLVKATLIWLEQDKVGY